MAWRGSAVFTAHALAVLTGDPVLAGTWTAGRATWHRFALYGRGITPDRDAPLPETFYGTGEWDTAGEITSGISWPQGGAAPLAVTLTGGTSGAYGLNVAQLQRPQVTVAGVAGDLMYYGPPAGPAAGRGECFHDYGGLVDVAGGGVLTLAWTYPPGTIVIGDPAGGP